MTAGWGVLLAALILTTTARAESLHLDLTDPQHLPAERQPPSDAEPLPPYTIRVRPRIVYALPDKLTGWVQEDIELSRLCRRGAFVQKQDRFFWARTPQRSYGVAFPTGGSLIDLANKAKRPLVYFFQDQDGDCHVFAGPMARLMPYYKP